MSEQIRLTEAEREALLIARHDETCNANCGEDVSTYPKVRSPLFAAVERIVADRIEADHA